MLIKHRFLRFFDWINFFLTLSIIFLGLLFVFSSTYRVSAPYSIFFKKQLFGSVTGLIIYFAFSLFPLQLLTHYGYLGLLVTILLLCYTHIAGLVALGGKRWISLYIIKFQPSDLARLFLPSFLSFYALKEKEALLQPLSYKHPLVLPSCVLLVIFVLIAKQPDLGSALIVLMSGIVLLWMGGIRLTFFISLALVGSLSMPLIWTKALKPYQQQRIMVLLGYGDTRKERYHIEQSKIAIGSGGILGKGFLQGTQNKLEFLPEDHTDFIFSVICEEWGLVGSTFLIFLFITLFTRIIIGICALHEFQQQIIATGLVLHVMLSFIINIGMVIGLLPIVGIPLPFISYGITNLWISLASLGWIQNILLSRYFKP